MQPLLKDCKTNRRYKIKNSDRACPVTAVALTVMSPNQEV